MRVLEPAPVPQNRELQQRVPAVTRNFKRDDPDRFERYQAEALVHQHMPLGALRGVACYDAAAKQEVEAIAVAANVTLKVAVRPGWYP